LFYKLNSRSIVRDIPIFKTTDSANFRLIVSNMAVSCNGADNIRLLCVTLTGSVVLSAQVNSLQCHHVRPVTDDISETLLTEECKIQTGLSEEAIKHAQPLEQVLEEVRSRFA